MNVRQNCRCRSTRVCRKKKHGGNPSYLEDGNRGAAHARSVSEDAQIYISIFRQPFS